MSDCIHPSVDSGTVNALFADNFSLTAGMTAVPEPSTSTAIAGPGALGLALWRRRQKSAA